MYIIRENTELDFFKRAKSTLMMQIILLPNMQLFYIRIRKIMDKVLYVWKISFSSIYLFIYLVQWNKPNTRWNSISNTRHKRFKYVWAWKTERNISTFDSERPQGEHIYSLEESVFLLRASRRHLRTLETHKSALEDLIAAHERIRRQRAEVEEDRLGQFVEKSWL